MIKINPECYSCLLRQVEIACKYGKYDEKTAIRSLRRAAQYISGTDPDDVPAKIASRLHKIVRETAGNFDPFDGVKKEQKDRFNALYSLIREKVEDSGDRFETAVLLSGAGNIYDYGIISREEAGSFFHDLESFQKGIFDLASLRNALKNSRVIGLLLDNTGEAAFDLVLAEQLFSMGFDVWLGVKGGPVIDDITYSDALDLGLEKRAKIVSNGSQAVGTDLEDASAEFREMIDSSDLIISKGQANFETLYGKLEKSFFLFVCKCPVMERVTGAEFGNIMLVGGGTVDETGKGSGLPQFR